VLNENYPIVVDWLAQHRGFRHVQPRAGGIAWIKLADHIQMSSDELAENLRRDKSVLIVPGSQFGPGFERFIRIGFAGSAEHLREGLARFSELLGELAGAPMSASRTA
jgi:aminotransferase